MSQEENSLFAKRIFTFNAAIPLEILVSFILSFETRLIQPSSSFEIIFIHLGRVQITQDISSFWNYYNYSLKNPGNILLLVMFCYFSVLL